MSDVTILGALLAGIVSFLSPCVLPLVPGYISIVSGASLEQLKSEDLQGSLKRTVVLNSIMFIIGFSITFIALGASATWLGQALQSKMAIFSKFAGVLLVIFGLHLTGIFKINFLYQDKRFHNVQKPKGLIGALVLGLAFAFGWSPCIGPILAGILTMASTQQTVGEGILLLMVYSLGLGIPFLLTSLGLNQFLAFYSRFKRHFVLVERLSGALVIVMGILIYTNNLSRLAGYLTFLNRFAL